jgi:large subunit ribosomal protein L21
VYAIVRSGGRQLKASVGDVLELDRRDAEVGATVELTPLLVVDGTTVTSDAASLGSAAVTAEVLGEIKGPKVIIQHFKNKSGYRRRAGHRQRYTRVKVTGINGSNG